MTLIVGCHFTDGVILIADSRATWQYPAGQNLFQDALQKILPLLPTACVAYAGDVKTAASLIRSLSDRIKHDNRLKNVGYLGLNVGRFARHDFATLQGRGRKPDDVTLVLAGIEARGTTDESTVTHVRLWSYSAPRFRPHEAENGFIAAGSGADSVTPFLKDHWLELQNQSGGIKEKADWLSLRLEYELGKGDGSVGGLFQMVLIQPDGLHPVSYSKLNLDPDDGPDPVNMTIDNGIWTQTNLRSGISVPVLDPSRLVQELPRPTRVRDYSQQTPPKHRPESILTYCVLCREADTYPGNAVFSGTSNSVACSSFPATIPIVVGLAVHPYTGSHKLSLRFGATERTMSAVHEEEFTSTLFLEEIRRNICLNLPVTSPGNYYVELWVDEYRLARKPLLIVQTIPEISQGPEPTPEALSKQQEHMRECLQSAVDPELASGNVFLAYFVPCSRAELTEERISFKGVGNIFFPPSFPGVSNYFLAWGFRAKRGTYNVRLTLTETTARKATLVTTTTVEAAYDFMEVNLLGKVPLTFPQPGVYVLDVYLDDKRIARAHFFANDINYPMTHKLRKADIERVRNGESLMLARDAVPVKTLQPEELARLDESLARLDEWMGGLGSERA